MAKNAFELLLDALPDEEIEVKGSAREVLVALAEKVPKIKDSVMAQSDYSRKMDQIRKDSEMIERWNKWRTDNWDDDRGMVKSEIEKAEAIVQLQQELEAARTAAAKSGDEMTFDQLQEWIKDYETKRGTITKTDLESTLNKRGEDFSKLVSDRMATMFTAGVTTSELGQRYLKEFGEPLKQMDFLKAANEKGRTDLDDFYEHDFILSKRQERTDKLHKEEIERVTKERDDALLKAKEELERVKAATMGTGGPIDMGAPELGHLQRRLSGLDTPPPEDGSIPKDLPLGSLAQMAARRDDQRALETRTA
jgi:hypothetical protein